MNYYCPRYHSKNAVLKMMMMMMMVVVAMVM